MRRRENRCSNLQTYLMAVRCLDALDRADVEREFTDRYERAIASSGQDYADDLARSETLFLLANSDFDFEGVAYLKSHLR